MAAPNPHWPYLRRSADGHWADWGLLAQLLKLLEEIKVITEHAVEALHSSGGEWFGRGNVEGSLTGDHTRPGAFFRIAFRICISGLQEKDPAIVQSSAASLAGRHTP